MLQRKNWMLMPEYEKLRYFTTSGNERKIIGLDVETSDFYPNDIIFMIQVYADDLKRVFFPDDEKDMRELSAYLFANRKALISCFNTIFDVPRMFYAIGQNVDWVMKKSIKQPEKERYSWKIDKKYPKFFDWNPFCYFDIIPMPMLDHVKKVDARVKFSTRINPNMEHAVFKSHECTWMFGSVAQAAPVLGLQKLDRNLAVLNDNKRARMLVKRRNRLKTDEDIKDFKYLIDYGMVDAEISYKAAMLQQELLPISVGANSPATPARLMIKNARLPQAPQRVMNETWEAYFGGLSLMMDRGVHHSKKLCYIFDFLSMYPSTIKNLKLLNLDYIDAKGFDWDVPKNVSDVLDFEYHFCVHAKVKGIVLSKEMCWHDGIPKLVPVQGEYEGWFWDCELPFLEVLDWDDIRYFAYMKEYPIQEEVERMLLKRAQMKSTDPQRLGYKILLNSMYGVICQYNPKAGAAFSAHKGSLLTAMCRSTLLDTIIRNYPNAIMADTDSLGTVGKPKYDPKLMQLQFDKTIDFNDWSKEKHYYFQNEFEFYHYIAVRLKRYMLIRDWHDDWTFSDYINENKRIKNENIQEPKIIKYALHATTISIEFMDKVFDYIVGKEVDVPERYMMAYRQTFKRWLSEGKMEMIGGFTKSKELVGKLDFGIYMDNFIRPDNKLYRKDEHWLKCEKGRFHTEGTLKPYANCKPYVQHLRELKDDKDKQKMILDLFNKYQVNTEGWSS